MLHWKYLRLPAQATRADHTPKRPFSRGNVVVRRFAARESPLRSYSLAKVDGEHPRPPVQSEHKLGTGKGSTVLGGRVRSTRSQPIPVGHTGVHRGHNCRYTGGTGQIDAADGRHISGIGKGGACAWREMHGGRYLAIQHHAPGSMRQYRAHR